MSEIFPRSRGADVTDVRLKSIYGPATDEISPGAGSNRNATRVSGRGKLTIFSPFPSLLLPGRPARYGRSRTYRVSGESESPTKEW